MFLLNILWYLWSLGKCFTISFIKIFPTLILTWLSYRELSHITLLISTQNPVYGTYFSYWNTTLFSSFVIIPFRFLKSCSSQDISDIPQETFVLMKTSRRRLLSSSSDDILRASSRRLDQDEYIRLTHTSSEDGFKTDILVLAIVFKTFSRRFQDVFKTSCKTSPRHLKDIWQRCLQGVSKDVSSG